MEPKEQKLDTNTALHYLSSKLAESEKLVAIHLGIIALKDKEIAELKEKLGETKGD